MLVPYHTVRQSRTVQTMSYGEYDSALGISYRYTLCLNHKPSLQIQYLLHNNLDSRRHHFVILCWEVLNEMYNDKVLFEFHFRQDNHAT